MYCFMYDDDHQWQLKILSFRECQAVTAAAAKRMVNLLDAGHRCWASFTKLMMSEEQEPMITRSNRCQITVACDKRNTK